MIVLVLALWGSLSAVPQKPGTADDVMGAAIHLGEVEGRLEEAIAMYRKVLAVPGVSRALAARAQLQIGICYERLGKREARLAYEAVIRNYPGQQEIVQEARNRLAELNISMPEPKAPTGPVIRRIPIPKGVLLPGPPSPDGRHVAFLEAGTRDVAVWDIAAGTTRRITHFDPTAPDHEFVLGMAWNPLGEQLAYASIGGTKKYTDLRIIDLRSLDSRSIYRGCEAGFWLQSWSPDGSSILAWDDEVRGLLLVSPKDGSAKKIDSLKSENFSQIGRCSMSPNNRFAACDFRRSGRKDFDIGLFPVAGGPEIPVVGHGADDRLFGWAPDMSRIYFASDRSGTIDLWQIRLVEGRPQGEPELVKSDLGDVRPLGITKNGTFFYDRGRNTQDVYVTSVDLDTGNVLSPARRVHPSRVGNSSLPAWSADGRFLAYLCTEPAPRDAINICIWSQEDGSQRQLTNLPIEPGSRLLWSSDGREILARGSKMENGTAVIRSWRMDAVTGKVIGEAPSSLVITPDNKTAFEWSLEPKTRSAAVFARDLESGRKEEIYRSDDPPQMMLSRVSPDGRWFSFVVVHQGHAGAKSQAVMIVRTAGGEAREIFGIEEPAALDLVEWTADSANLLCLQRASAGRQATELWKVPVEGGGPVRIDLPVGRARSLAASPDGKHLAFTSFHTASREIWTMDGIWQPVTKAAQGPDICRSTKRGAIQ